MRLAFFFWPLVCAVSGMIWLVSERHGSGGDPAGNGMSTGIIELLADTFAVITGVLALTFVVFKGPVVRVILTVLLGAFAVLLVAILTS